jgi:hypothetical protein
MKMPSGEWKRGPLTILYHVHLDSVRIDTYLYEIKIGYATLTPSHTCVRKTACAELAKVDLNLSAEFVEKKLTCSGNITTYCIETHEWKTEDLDDNLAKW